MRPQIARLANQLADQVADEGSDGSVVDLISSYAGPLPVQVIAELLGVPAPDWHMLRPWSNAIVKMYEYDVPAAKKVAAEQAAQEFVEYLRDLVAARRRAPRQDLISSLIAEETATKDVVSVQTRDEGDGEFTVIFVYRVA